MLGAFSLLVEDIFAVLLPIYVALMKERHTVASKMICS